MNRFTNFIVLLLAIFLVISTFTLFNDFCRFPECYLKTWKYQLQNEIEQGNEKAIEYYNRNYIEHGRVLFE